MDPTSYDLARAVIELIDRLTRDPCYAPEVLFLDCAPEVLERRYNETRRRHPLSPDASPVAGVMVRLLCLLGAGRFGRRVGEQLELDV